jgi:hypothetical protein
MKMNESKRHKFQDFADYVLSLNKGFIVKKEGAEYTNFRYTHPMPKEHSTIHLMADDTIRIEIIKQNIDQIKYIFEPIDTNYLGTEQGYLEYIAKNKVKTERPDIESLHSNMSYDEFVAWLTINFNYEKTETKRTRSGETNKQYWALDGMRLSVSESRLCLPQRTEYHYNIIDPDVSSEMGYGTYNMFNMLKLLLHAKYPAPVTNVAVNPIINPKMVLLENSLDPQKKELLQSLREIESEPSLLHWLDKNKSIKYIYCSFQHYSCFDEDERTGRDKRIGFSNNKVYDCNAWILGNQIILRYNLLEDKKFSSKWYFVKQKYNPEYHTEKTIGAGVSRFLEGDCWHWEDFKTLILEMIMTDPSFQLS